MKYKKTLTLLVLILLLGESMTANAEQLIIDCNGFENGGIIPIKYTGRGENLSPEFLIRNLSANGKTIVIILDDVKHHIFGTYNHWIIWNIPLVDKIPENIPAGKIVPELGNAMQGIGYGRYRYRGPKPPKGTQHEYKFNFYVLDCELSIKNNSHKKQLMKAIEGHIIQYGFITGKYE
jgi:Raf kinase inhibitor-like YbhB/YbcL family protein